MEMGDDGVEGHMSSVTGAEEGYDEILHLKLLSDGSLYTLFLASRFRSCTAYSYALLFPNDSSEPVLAVRWCEEVSYPTNYRFEVGDGTHFAIALELLDLEGLAKHY